MKESIFRKKSLERISSPEEIDDYIKVTSLSMWLLIGAVILLLVAVIIWSITGRIETTLEAEGQVSDSQVRVQIPDDRMDELAVGSEVRAGSKSGQVIKITEQAGGYLVDAFIPELEDGTVKVTLVTESIAPIAFLVD